MSKHLKTIVYKAALISTALGLLGFTIALAASGDLDPTFDGDGLVTTNVDPSHPEGGDTAQDIALQPDGKIVAVGQRGVSNSSIWDFAIARYNPNGSLDNTFSGDGRRTVNMGGLDSATAVAVQPDGKIVVVGEADRAGTVDVAIVRLNANGSLDTTFSGDGKQITDFGGRYNYADAVALQSDGKILVAGVLGNQTLDFAVYRYLSDGRLDPTFGGDGRVSFGFGTGRDDLAADLAIQSDGKIVVAGTSGIWFSIEELFIGDFALARLNPNGTLDTTFSGDGRQATNFGDDELADGLALQPDGKLVLVGRKVLTGVNFQIYFAVARYTADGSLDLTFNGRGKKTFSIIPGQISWANDVVVSAGGKIIVMGTTENRPDQGNFAVVRLNSNGSLDRTFSADGRVAIDFGARDEGYAILLQPVDGKYVLGGYTCDPPRPCDFALARVLP